MSVGYLIDGRSVGRLMVDHALTIFFDSMTSFYRVNVTVCRYVCMCVYMRALTLEVYKINSRTHTHTLTYLHRCRVNVEKKRYCRMPPPSPGKSVSTVTTKCRAVVAVVAASVHHAIQKQQYPHIWCYANACKIKK